MLNTARCGISLCDIGGQFKPSSAVIVPRIAPFSVVIHRVNPMYEALTIEAIKGVNTALCSCYFYRPE